MEASEKPQLPLERAPGEGAGDGAPDAGEVAGGAADGGSVRAIGDRIVIERLDVADERAASVVRERAEAGQPPAETVRTAIEIGARVLDREESAVEVDYVRREFEQVTSAHRQSVEEKSREVAERIEKGLERALGTEGAPGTLGEALESHSGELAEMIATTFGEDREGAVQAQIKRLLEERDEEFMRRLAADDERNPLGPMLGTLRNWTKERKEDQDLRDQKLELKLDEFLSRAAKLAGLDQAQEEIAAAEAAGTRKGRSFEDRAHAAIEAIAAARGDIAHHVGDQQGEAGSKKGDTLVEIGAAEGATLGRIAFEFKDSQLSRPKAWEELNGALAARAASFAVLVVAGEGSIPPGREQLHEYEGNKLIVAVDPDEPGEAALDVAYRFARLRVLLAREAELTVDAAGVRDAAAEAKGALDGAKAIKSSLTKATNNIDQARVAVEGMIGTVLERLERIETLVDSAEES